MNDIPHRLDLWAFNRFMDKTLFLDELFGNEKSTNRRTDCIYYSACITFATQKKRLVLKIFLSELRMISMEVFGRLFEITKLENS